MAEQFCLVCGQPLPPYRGGRRRHYCSGACRVRAHRQRARRSQPPTPNPTHVVVISCPGNLYTRGASFCWQDFRTSLDVWPEQMQVQYQGQHYRVHHGQLEPLALDKV